MNNSEALRYKAKESGSVPLNPNVTEEDEDSYHFSRVLKTIEDVKFVCHVIRTGKVEDMKQYNKDSDSRSK